MQTFSHQSPINLEVIHAQVISKVLKLPNLLIRKLLLVDMNSAPLWHPMSWVVSTRSILARQTFNDQLNQVLATDYYQTRIVLACHKLT